MSGLSSGFRVPGRSTDAIRQAALAARATLKVGDGRPNLGRLIESLHLFGIVVDIFDRDTAPVGAGVEACWVPESFTLYIRDSVYEQACRGSTRAIFTIAHEIGHIVLSHRRTLNREAPWTVIEPYANSEWQADTFAAEFSMPLPIILQRCLLTPDAISRVFGVSTHAAHVRLNKLRERNLI